MSINVCTFVGNLTRDPELRKTPSGAVLAEFGLAVNESWTDAKTKEKKESVSFLNFTTWGAQAENLCKYKRKGDSLAIVGRARQDRWVDKTTGKNRSAIAFVADNIQYIGAKREETDEERREAGRAANRDGDDDRPAYTDADVPADVKAGADPQEGQTTQERAAGFGFTGKGAPAAGAKK